MNLAHEKEKTKAISPRYIYTHNQYLELTQHKTYQKKIHKNSPADFIEEVVNSISNGLDIKKVDPMLYSVIIDSLEDKKKEFLFSSNKNICAAKIVSKAIDHINKYFLNQEKERKRKEEIEKAEKKKEKVLEMQKRNSNVFTKSDLDKAVSKILEYESNRNNKMIIREINPEIYSFLIDELRLLKSEAIDKKDFKMAEKYENSVRIVILLKSEKKYSEITNSHASELKYKFKSAIKNYRKLQFSLEQKISLINEQIDSQIKQIQEETNQILAEFDKQFIQPSNNFLNASRQAGQISVENEEVSQSDSNYELDKNDVLTAKFKPSAKLLELRKCEKSLAISKRYEEAKIMRKKNDKIELFERNQFVIQYNNELRKKRKEIIDRQQELINAVCAKGEEKLEMERMKMEEQLNQAELALRHLEESVNEAQKMTSLLYLSSNSNFAINDQFNENLSSSSEKSTAKQPHKIECRTEKLNGENNENLEIWKIKRSAQTPRIRKRNVDQVFDERQNQNNNDLMMSHLQRKRQCSLCNTPRGRHNNLLLEQNMFYKRRLINSIVYSKSCGKP